MVYSLKTKYAAGSLSLAQPKSQNGNILALDLGEQLIGMALYCPSSEASVPAQTADAGVYMPLKPIVRQTGGGLALGALRRTLARYQVCTLVVGLPVVPQADNFHAFHSVGRRRGQNFRKLKAYAKRLQKHFPALSFATVNEAYTTWHVKNAFPGIEKTATATGSDSLAALAILKTYLAKNINEG